MDTMARRSGAYSTDKRRYWEIQLRTQDLEWLQRALGREVRRARDGGAPQGFRDGHAFKAWTLFREIRKRCREVA